MGDAKSYWVELAEAVTSVLSGLRITLRHLLHARRRNGTFSIAEKDYFSRQIGIATVSYPHEALPVPDTGRYRLHNEIDDCIVCDKCAKICPVNCIEIEPIKAVEEIGKTSDGTPKRIHAARFDIDMAKCCFCGLCTTVCPTECLTMTKVYDFSVTEIKEHNFAFAVMTPQQIAATKEAYEASLKAKQTTPTAAPAPNEAEVKASPAIKPVFRPKPKPNIPPSPQG